MSVGGICDPCPSGRYTTSNSECLHCAAGRFVNGTRNTACFSCSGGRYALGEASTVCWLCDQGYLAEFLLTSQIELDSSMFFSKYSSIEQPMSLIACANCDAGSSSEIGAVIC